jgi:hypothetical protein
MKIFACACLLVSLIATLPAAASPANIMGGVGHADRQRNKGLGGRCPLGTCSMMGTPFAKHLNLCRASNCYHH